MIHVDNNISTRNTVEYNPSVTVVDPLTEVPYVADVLIRYQPSDVVLDHQTVDEWLDDISTLDRTPHWLVYTVYNRLLEVLKPNELSVVITFTTTAHSPLRISIP